MGDLNVNFMNKSDKDNKELFSLYGFKQLIKKPTRISKDTKSLIDIIAKNNNNYNWCFSNEHRRSRHDWMPKEN